MDEEIELNFEIIDTLKVLVQHTQWDSNNLKIKLEEKNLEFKVYIISMI